MHNQLWYLVTAFNVIYKLQQIHFNENNDIDMLFNNILIFE